MENNGKIRILINIDEKESALILIIVWKFQLKKCSRKRFCWNFSTGNVFRLEFLNRKRFSVGISQPETFFGWNFSTGNVFSVKISQPETFFGWNFSTGNVFRLEFFNRKRFSVGILQPESVFRL